MVGYRPGLRPTLSSWTEVDPALYPFDPSDVAASMPTGLPGPGQSEFQQWREAVSIGLSGRYGPWAYFWYWSPEGRGPYNWVTRFPPPADAPAFAADSLRTWRRWLERIAERFDEFLPLLERAAVAGPADLAATWESATIALMRTAIAWVIDDDYWPGSCRTVLKWFLTATGVPAEQAGTLVANAIDGRFDDWLPPRSADIADVAERLTRSVLDLSGTAQDAVTGEWPDTWPQNWPIWRATNTTGSPSA
ncbi:hypothetical protein [Krasilnikovia sp. MM14-A1259]|uniref:hypothetical protein n=1 Tax=Krasilnikovia sp. MM14-A1259 TaxID=3373539 RepID=UPI003826D62B